MIIEIKISYQATVLIQILVNIAIGEVKGTKEHKQKQVERYSENLVYYHIIAPIALVKVVEKERRA